MILGHENLEPCVTKLCILDCHAHVQNLFETIICAFCHQIRELVATSQQWPLLLMIFNLSILYFFTWNVIYATKSDPQNSFFLSCTHRYFEKYFVSQKEVNTNLAASFIKIRNFLKLCVSTTNECSIHFQCDKYQANSLMTYEVTGDWSNLHMESLLPIW